MTHFWPSLLLTIFLSFSGETSVVLAAEAPTPSSPPASASASDSSHDLSSLKEFFYNLITERDRQYTQRFDAQEKAVAAALAATEKATAAAFAAQEKATAAAFAAAKEAVAKAETSAEKRFDSVNEFRGQLKDQQTLFVQKSENDVKFKALIERIDDAAKMAPTLTPRVESDARYKAVSDRMDAIDARLIASNANVTTILARGEGASNLWIIIAGGLGLLISIVAIFLTLRGNQNEKEQERRERQELRQERLDRMERPRT